MLPPLKRIGIGIGGDAGKVIASAGALCNRVHVTCYCGQDIAGTRAPSPPACVTFAPHAEPHEALIADLMSGAIDAAVRGTLPANATLQALKRETGVDHLERIALLETVTGKKFLLAPVGVDEGWTVQEKLALIGKGRNIAKRFGISEEVGILSGGRFGDIGRHPQVDATMADAELVARLGGARHFEILIEDAVERCGIIIAPDGISGNLIFRTLIFLGGGHGHGAPVLNIGKIFVDTSRASPDYTNALKLAASLLD
jgi:putative methanogen marker protein 4